MPLIAESLIYACLQLSARRSRRFRLPSRGYSYSKAVQKACASDYQKHCGQYGIETEALRLCMDRSGHSLTKTCVNALIDAGEVSKDEVERRKRVGR